MLAIGNAINNYYLGKHPSIKDNVEFICWSDEEIEKITKDKKLDKLNIYHKNSVSKTYLQDKRYVTIHDARQTPLFNMFLKEFPLLINRTGVAPMLLTYAWAKCKTMFIHDDVKDWVNYAQVYSTIYKNHIKPGHTKVNVKTRVLATTLTRFGAVAYNTVFTPYTFKPYTMFTEESLFGLFKYNPIRSLYQKCMLHTTTKLILSKSLFGRFNYNEQIQCVLERIYVDCANEYILDDVEYKKIKHESTKKLVQQCIMNRCSQNEYPWFNDFIIGNYNTIMAAFDPYFLDELQDAVQYSMLEKALPNLKIIH